MLLLPYIEQQGLWDQYDTSVSWSKPANLPVSSLRISTYECPTAPKQNYTMDHEPDGFRGGISPWIGVVAVGDYGASLGVSPALGALSIPTSPIDSSTYPTSGGAFITNGFLPKNSRVRLADITDGTSNTFLFAESQTPVPWAKPADIVMAPNGPIGVPPDRFLACMADGSVRFISETINTGSLAASEVTSGKSPYGVWGALGTRDGREPSNSAN